MNFYQKIYFGIPGCGKSYKVHKEVIPNDLNIEDDSNIIKTVFHPEYGYGDFMGKLLPITNDSKVEYNYYAGHFLRALAQAYKNLLDSSLDEDSKNVALVIDEINRGNSSAIFGSIFQLLDRDDDGWSSYEINLSEMEFNKLIELIFKEKIKEIKKEFQKEKIISIINKKAHNLLIEQNQIFKTLSSEKIEICKKITLEEEIETLDEFKFAEVEIFKTFTDDEIEVLKIFLSENIKIIEILKKFLTIDKNKSIKIPLNLSIIGTMNTSDESIFYMDSAFKRRWDWEYIKNYWGYIANDDRRRPRGFVEKFKEDEEKYFIIKELNSNIYLNEKEYYWVDFITKLNNFLLKQSSSIRGVEDKQIGFFFIKAIKNEEKNLSIPIDKIKNKLMFYLWDSIFSRDKEPLNELLSTKDSKVKLNTFGEFQNEVEKFIEAIWTKYDNA